MVVHVGGGSKYLYVILLNAKVQCANVLVMQRWRAAPHSALKSGEKVQFGLDDDCLKGSE